PLVQGIPFVEDLTANAGYRYSSYTSAGAVHSYKYGLEWQPIDDVRFRASFQRAVRAPNVLELFTPQGLTLVGATDPCAGPVGDNGLVASGLTPAQCGNTGVTPHQYGHIIDCISAQCNSFAGGNLNLKPESSDT